MIRLELYSGAVHLRIGTSSAPGRPEISSGLRHHIRGRIAAHDELSWHFSSRTSTMLEFTIVMFE